MADSRLFKPNEIKYSLTVVVAAVSGLSIGVDCLLHDVHRRAGGCEASGCETVDLV